MTTAIHAHPIITLPLYLRYLPSRRKLVILFSNNIVKVVLYPFSLQQLHIKQGQMDGGKNGGNLETYYDRRARDKHCISFPKIKIGVAIDPFTSQYTTKNNTKINAGMVCDFQLSFIPNVWNSLCASINPRFEIEHQGSQVMTAS